MIPAGATARRRKTAMAAVVCLATSLAAGCASGRATGTSTSEVSDFIGRTRAVSAEARPQSQSIALTLESWDPALRDALTEVSIAPNPAAYRRVAAAYRRFGVLDMAYGSLMQAVELDPADAGAHDELARIWRDWGFPHLGLDHSRRAVELAPHSPEAANTLGTLYAAGGVMEEAGRWFTRALTLDPSAAYARTNLCYVAITRGDTGAVGACEQAAAAQPDSQGTRNNLGLAYAAAGDLERARDRFAQGGEAAAHYNMGIVFLAQRRYAQAVEAFAAALAADPHLPHVAARVQQSRALMVSGQVTPGTYDED